MDEEVVLTPAKSPGGGTLITMVKVHKTSSLRHNASPVADGPYQGIIIAKSQEGTGERKSPHVSRDFRVYVMNPFLDDTHPLIREKRELHFWFKEDGGRRSQTQGENTVDQYIKKLLTNKDDFPPDYVTYIKHVLQLVTDSPLIHKVELEIRPLLPEDDKKEQSYVIRQNFSSSAANQSLASLITHANKPEPAPQTTDKEKDASKSAPSESKPEDKNVSNPTASLSAQENTKRSKSPALPRKPPGLASKVRSPLTARKPTNLSPGSQPKNTEMQIGMRSASPTPKPRRSLMKPSQMPATETEIMGSSQKQVTQTAKPAESQQSHDSKGNVSESFAEGDGLTQADRCGTINRTEQRKTITINKPSISAKHEAPPSADSQASSPAPQSEPDTEVFSQTDRYKTINRTEQRKTITITKSNPETTPSDTLSTRSPLPSETDDESLSQTDRYKTVSRTESRKTISVKATALSQQTSSSSTPAVSDNIAATDPGAEDGLTQTARYKTINRKEERKTISVSQQAMTGQQQTTTEPQQMSTDSSHDDASLTQAEKEATIKRTERRKTLEVKPQVLAVQQSSKGAAPKLERSNEAAHKKKVLTRTGRLAVCAIKKRRILSILEDAYPNVITNAEIIRISRYRSTEVKIFLRDLTEKRLVCAHTLSVITGNDHWTRVQPIEARNGHEMNIVQTFPRLSSDKQPRVAIVTALYCEKIALDALIKEKSTYVKYRHDSECTLYTFGKIGNQTVVTIKLPDPSTSSEQSRRDTGSVVTRLLACFTSIEHVILAGVGSSVPSFHDPFKHSRLGDILVSLSSDNQSTCLHVAQNNSIQSCLSAKSRMSDVIVALKNQQNSNMNFSRPWEVYLQEGLDYLKSGHLLYERPPPLSDKLYKQTGEGDRLLVGHPASPSCQEHERRVGLPVVHYGVVASRSDWSAVTANDAVRENNIRAFSDWLDPVMEVLRRNQKTSFAVVCGIASYGEENCRSAWESYSALSAAAYVKALVLGLDDSNITCVPKPLSQESQPSALKSRPTLTLKNNAISDGLDSKQTTGSPLSPPQNAQKQINSPPPLTSPKEPPPLPKQPPPALTKQPQQLTRPTTTMKNNSKSAEADRKQATESPLSPCSPLSPKDAAIGKNMSAPLPSPKEPPPLPKQPPPGVPKQPPPAVPKQPPLSTQNGGKSNEPTTQVQKGDPARVTRRQLSDTTEQASTRRVPPPRPATQPNPTNRRSSSVKITSV